MAKKTFRKLPTSMWDRMEFRILPVRSQYLWLFLLTSKFSGDIPGAITARRSELAAALVWDVRELDQAFDLLVAKGLVKASDDSEAVGLYWAPRSLAHNPPQSPNVAKHWARALESLPACDLRDTIRADIEKYLEFRGCAFAGAFRGV